LLLWVYYWGTIVVLGILFVGVGVAKGIATCTTTELIELDTTEKVNYMVFDMYNWLANSTATLFEGLIPTDGELHKLHEAGLAREFYQSGIYSEKLSWENKPWIL